MRSLAAAVMLCVCASTAQARTSEPVFDRHNPSGSYHDATPQRLAGVKQMRRKHQRRYYRDKVSKHYARKHPYKGHSASLSDVTPVLAAKAAEIISKCGAKVISGYRPGARVRGYGTPSLHARYPAEAVDMKGDKNCMYPLLKDWPGGYSVDYAAVAHLHISMASDRRERWARFSHYGTRRYARRR